MKINNHSNGLVSVATFDRTADADTLKSLIEREGIEAKVQDETRLQRFWFMSAPKAGIHVQAPREALEQIQKLFAEPRFQAPLRKAVHCPSCSSTKVQYPAFTRKNILPALIMLVPVLLRIRKHSYYCEDCHFTWPRVPLPPETQLSTHGTPFL